MKKMIDAKNQHQPEQIQESDNNQMNRFYQDYEKALEQAKKDNKLMMLHFTTEWCNWCKELDTKTYQNPEAQKLLKQLICVKIDTEKENGAVLSQKYYINSYPHIIFINANEEAVDFILGFTPPDEFVGKVNKILNNQDTLPFYREQMIANPKNFHALVKGAEIELGTGLIERGLDDCYTIIKNADRDKDQAIIKTAHYLIINHSIPESAIELMDELISKYADDPVLYSDRAVMHFNQRNFAKAIDDFNKLIEFDPKSSAAYKRRGEVYYHDLKYEQAIEDFSKAIDLGDKNADTFNFKGASHNWLGDFGQALEDFNLGLELNPDHPLLLTNIGQIYLQTNNLDQALEYINRSIEIEPDYNDSAYYLRAIVNCNQSQDYVKAIQDLNKANEINPDNVSVYLYRANIHRLTNKNELVLKDYQKVFDISPAFTMAYFELTEFQITIGSYQAALDTLTKSSNYLSSDEDRFIFFYLQSVLKLLLNEDAADSITQFNRCLETKTPHRWDVGEMLKVIELVDISADAKEQILKLSEQFNEYFSN